MTITYKDYTMPCVGMTLKGEPLYQQPNGRLTTRRLINNYGKDLSRFTTIDVLNCQVCPVPPDFMGCDFDNPNIYAMVNTSNGFVHLYLNDFDNCLIRTHMPPLTEDTEYGNEAPKARVEDILFQYNEETERVFLEGGRVCIFSQRDWLNPQEIIDQYNAMQDERTSAYLLYADIDEDGYLIPHFYGEATDY